MNVIEDLPAGVLDIIIANERSESLLLVCVEIAERTSTAPKQELIVWIGN